MNLVILDSPLRFTRAFNNKYDFGPSRLNKNMILDVLHIEYSEIPL
jgi:hypothetical protein